MTDQEFINEIWNKYDNYLKENDKSKDNFFIKYRYKKIKIRRRLRMAFNFILSLISMAGIVYAGTVVHNYIQSTYKQEYPKVTTGGNRHKNMEYQEGVYYKKITSYEEYIKYKQEKPQILEMKEEDFKDNFLLITEFENTFSMIDFYISNITTDNQYLYIELTRDTEQNEENMLGYVNSTKIPKADDREKIVVKKNELIPTSTQYKSLEELPKNYTREQAIEDNCFVLDNRNKVISLNKEQMNEFVKKSQSGEECFIRIVHYYDSGIQIVDLEYKEGNYIICRDNSRGESCEIFYDVRPKLEVFTKYNNNGETATRIFLLDEYNEGLPVCYFVI